MGLYDQASVIQASGETSACVALLLHSRSFRVRVRGRVSVRAA